MTFPFIVILTACCRTELEKQEETHKKQFEEFEEKHADEISAVKKRHNEAAEKLNEQWEMEKEKTSVLVDENRSLNLEIEAMQLKVNELQEEIKSSDLERERAEFKTKLTSVKQKYALHIRWLNEWNFVLILPQVKHRDWRTDEKTYGRNSWPPNTRRCGCFTEKRCQRPARTIRCVRHWI